MVSLRRVAFGEAHLGLKAALIVSLVAGFIDFLVGIFFGRIPPSLISTTSLAAAVLAVFLGFISLWVLTGAISSIRRNLSPGKLANLLGLWTLLVASYVIVRGASTVRQWGWLLVAAGLAALAAGGIYLVYTVLERSPNAVRHLSQLCLLAPFILAFFCLIGAASLRLSGGLVPGPFGLTALILTSLAATFLVIRPGRRTLLALFALFLFVCATPLTLVVQSLRSDVNSSSEELPRIAPILLITVDTLRSDHVSCYEDGGGSTPNIDRLCRDGVVFTNTVSPSPWTLPSIGSILTGVSPLVHGATNPRSSVPSRIPLVAERVRAAGYNTGAFVNNIYLSPSRNLARGFEEYRYFPQRGVEPTLGVAIIKTVLPDTPLFEASTSGLTDLALGYMRSYNSKNFFLWVHYFDPHQPYTPPRSFWPTASPPARIGYEFGRLEDVRAGAFSPNAQEREWIEMLYDAELRFVDENIGRLLEQLDSTDSYADALIILTSDHGEEFWEHGGYEHGHTLYNELLKVPLVMKFPESRHKTRIEIQVSTTSVAATILEFIGLTTNHWMAPSLLSMIEAPRQLHESQPIVSTGTLYFEERTGVFLDGYKYIRSVESGREELFDLLADPKELSSVASESPERVEHARHVLELMNSKAAEARSSLGIESGGTESPPDPVMLDQLKALGYIQ